MISTTVYTVFFSLLRGCERILIFVGRAIYFLLGFHIFEVKGRQASVREAPLVCIAPHSSFLDGFVFFMGNALPSTVSKAENTGIPFFGSMYSDCSLLFFCSLCINRYIVSINAVIIVLNGSQRNLQ